jgi:hypothetical protein
MERNKQNGQKNKDGMGEWINPALR